MPIIYIRGIKNKICLISSYKAVLLKIKNIGIIKIVISIVPKKILFFSYLNIFFSVIGINNKPIKTISGNLIVNQSGIYLEIKFWAGIQFPKSIVQTVASGYFLNRIIASIIWKGFFQKTG